MKPEHAIYLARCAANSTFSDAEKMAMLDSLFGQISAADLKADPDLRNEFTEATLTRARAELNHFDAHTARGEFTEDELTDMLAEDPGDPAH